ncbi:hypothetical protein T03_8265 [Trichinella britovi]|uniref:Uncharacterized protein n=1 Tax=Trichinella britovi TaxID=45882 RepID=A0A0V1CTX5_TRIBR|nr:hypothetical protein T03_8265 [Trichinella britovi]
MSSSSSSNKLIITILMSLQNKEIIYYINFKLQSEFFQSLDVKNCEKLTVKNRFCKTLEILLSNVIVKII